MLSVLFTKWSKLDDFALLEEVKKAFPGIMAATREECLKHLVMDFVERHFL